MSKAWAIAVARLVPDQPAHLLAHARVDGVSRRRRLRPVTLMRGVRCELHNRPSSPVRSRPVWLATESAPILKGSAESPPAGGWNVASKSGPHRFAAAWSASSAGFPSTSRREKRTGGPCGRRDRQNPEDDDHVPCVGAVNSRAGSPNAASARRTAPSSVANASTVFREGRSMGSAYHCSSDHQGAASRATAARST